MSSVYRTGAIYNLSHPTNLLLVNTVASRLVIGRMKLFKPPSEARGFVLNLTGDLIFIFQLPDRKKMVNYVGHTVCPQKMFTGSIIQIIILNPNNVNLKEHKEATLAGKINFACLG